LTRSGTAAAGTAAALEARFGWLGGRLDARFLDNLGNGFLHFYWCWRSILQIIQRCR
jgi:hypothetical protein